MMKFSVKKAICIGLTFAMALGTAACGGSGEGGGGLSLGFGKKNQNENAALAKEHVYRLQEFQMPDFGGDDYQIRASLRKDGLVYLVTEVYHWSEERDVDIQLMTMKEDGSDVQVVKAEMPDWRQGKKQSEPEGGAAATSEPEGGTAASGARTAETAVATPVDPGFAVEPEVQFVENTYYSNFCFSADGTLYAVRTYYYEDYSNGGNVNENRTYVSCWGKDGSLSWEKELEGLTSEETQLYVSCMFLLPDGTAKLTLAGDGKYYQMAVDPQGVSGRTPLPEELGKVFSNFNSALPREDGTILFVYYDESDYQKQYAVSYDPAAEKLGEPSALPQAISYNGYNVMTTGAASDLLYCNAKGVFAYSLGAQDVVQKMDFINSDVNIGYFNALIELSETSIFGVFNENYGEMKAGIFTYVDPKDIPDKAVLVFGGFYMGSDMKQRVVEYNRRNEKYRITVKEYDSYNSEGDYEAGQKQMNNDIISGNMPDILDVSVLPFENYVSKGLLADIGKRIAEDEELSKVEFVQNVLDAYSIDGKLYCIIPSFTAATVAGKKSILGDRTSWTMADLKQLMATMPEGTLAFGEMTRDQFLYNVMNYCGADFIDVSAGKCNFDSQNFIEMLEYAKSLPKELSEEAYGEGYWATYESQYRENRTVLRDMYIGSLSNVNYTLNGDFGEDVSYIGFPTESGMGAYVQARECFAISAKSANQDGAWDFMRYYLTEEFQSKLDWGLPVQKKYFLEKAQAATKRPYYLDENGNKVEYDDYFYMNNEEIKLDPLSQAQVDQLVNYIFSINKRYYGNTDIQNIITEECEPYFLGQKTAQEVVKIIQSKAQIYVDERR